MEFFNSYLEGDSSDDDDNNAGGHFSFAPANHGGANKPVRQIFGGNYGVKKDEEGKYEDSD